VYTISFNSSLLLLVYTVFFMITTSIPILLVKNFCFTNICIYVYVRILYIYIYIYIYIYHFHTLLQREVKVHKCHIALLSVLRNAITRNGGNIYNIYSLLGYCIYYLHFSLLDSRHSSLLEHSRQCCTCLQPTWRVTAYFFI